MVTNESDFRVKVAVRVSWEFACYEEYASLVQVRPFLPREKAHDSKSCVAIHHETNQIVLGDRRTFKYDFVFGPKTQQVSVHRYPLVFTSAVYLSGRSVSRLYRTHAKQCLRWIQRDHLRLRSDGRSSINGHCLHSLVSSFV